MSGYQPGDEFQCLSIPVKFSKVPIQDPQSGEQTLQSGFSIVGGIDQDLSKSPYNFKDVGIYVTKLAPNGPAQRAGLKLGDRILQCNGHDFTLVTHKKAIEYIKKYPIIEMLVEREDECINI